MEWPSVIARWEGSHVSLEDAMLMRGMARVKKAPPRVSSLARVQKARVKKARVNITPVKKAVGHRGPRTARGGHKAWRTAVNKARAALIREGTGVPQKGTTIKKGTPLYAKAQEFLRVR
jgi:hypothetical protein